ncbi:uncharacterized protein LOC123320721 isoform X2 [Coccinella septempunctata]|uniref:uncharacterized protein LOC123320721 isoform X2 n=1 Tax=Coccinella septempunctata TaxID=41139 RepID=UPI001D06B660|nr:uncharacterized protein LOC123320721 isoform X2 [Coccinella septempunctata]
MGVYSKIFSFLFFGTTFLIETNEGLFSGLFNKGPITESVLNVYCGYIKKAPRSEEPLLFSPWMVVLTTKSVKGRETVVKCGATLISGKNAITSEACLRQYKASDLQAILGAPSLKLLHQGTKKKVAKINVLLSDQRIAVLDFGYVIFGNTIRPVCLHGSEFSGVFATVGWGASKQPKKKKSEVTSKKVAYLSLQDYCRVDGYCAEVLPAEEPWEMTVEEIKEGSPLLVEKDSYWYLQGIMILLDDEDDENEEPNDEEGENKNKKKDETKKKEKDKKDKNKEKEEDKDENKENSGQDTDNGNDGEVDEEEKEDKAEESNPDENEGANENSPDENNDEKENEEKETNGDDNDDTEKGTDDENGEEEAADNKDVEKREARENDRSIRKRGKAKTYDIFFVKINAEILDELKHLMSLLS